jgi:hypothetical protein
LQRHHRVGCCVFFVSTMRLLPWSNATCEIPHNGLGGNVPCNFIVGSGISSPPNNTTHCTWLLCFLSSTLCVPSHVHDAVHEIPRDSHNGIRHPPTIPSIALALACCPPLQRPSHWLLCFLTSGHDTPSTLVVKRT